MVLRAQQVELPAGSRCVTAVSCGGSHTLAVDDQWRALCCGKNEHGRLGLGPGAWKNKLTFEVNARYYSRARQSKRLLMFFYFIVGYSS